MSDPIQLSALLTAHRPSDVISLIEQHGPRMGPALGAATLHCLAVLGGPLSEAERKKLFDIPCVGRLIMQLGSQLSGAGEIDSQGLTSILWALARLGQADSPLLTGLVRRLILLASHGAVPPRLLMIGVQSIHRLRLLGGAVGNAVLAHVQSNMGNFAVAELATLGRCLVDAL